jgi:hypothetical protein
MLLSLLLCGGASAAYTQGAAVESTQREARIQHLEREAAQYRASVDLLRANGADMDSAAIRALAGELKAIREELASLQAVPDTVDAQRQPAATKPQAPLTPEDAEARRLKQLLAAHYAAEEAAAAAPAEASASPVTAQAVQFDGSKIRLNGDEGVLALQKIEEELGQSNRDPSRRYRDLVFHVETRNNGVLVDSGSHSLRSLGQGQYVARIRLVPGSAKISVRRDDWRVDLDAGAGGEYLVTLSAPEDSQPRLHLIPVNELKAASSAELPTWLPASGAAARS